MKVLLLVMALNFACVSNVFAQKVAISDLPQLREQVVELLKQKYPSYSVMSLDEVIKHSFKSEHSNEYPGLVFGNFRHPSITDCAVLLVDFQKPKSSIKLLVLVLGVNTASPKIQIVHDYRKDKNPFLEVYLAYEQRRTVADIEKDTWVDMTSAGFSLNPFDRGGEQVFYWDNDKLKSVWVTD
jgi:hypothetical protein